ncbi:DoxX family membrane protein [Terrilactibacillus sp. BCM23-1]|uniref:DoxX family membrane protein n=1 Tax=Terrilactibacillus tamarindi TaxID=2599694 RepID=A0A6N8CQI4_9BACI|nr:DoxX family protein [Terrilactibacillus tamarindi]MTT31437.1 DoxX family membrane protein [Terrilactibacillus tamarindi]
MTDLGLFLIRMIIGIVFLFYGSQKLFGWFGGHGIKGTGGWFESIGIKPGILVATLSGFGELVSGILFILGFLLPLGAIIITIIMLGAIIKVHGSKGFSNTIGGFEYNLVLIVVSIGLALIGPGGYSL